jgi:hypothetical protein
MADPRSATTRRSEKVRRSLVRGRLVRGETLGADMTDRQTDGVQDLLIGGGTPTLVQVHRSVSSDPIEGFILAVGKEWMLLAALRDDISLDGFCVVRIEDIEEIEQRLASQRFVRRALTLQRAWPPTGPSVDLDTTGAMVAGVSSLNRTLSLFTEGIDEDLCFIGVPIGQTSTSLGLSEIRYTAEWEDDPTEWDFADITRVDFGEKYAARLLEVALEDDVPQYVSEHLDAVAKVDDAPT